MSSEREDGKEIGALQATVQLQQVQIEKLFDLQRKWTHEVRDEFRLFHDGIADIRRDIGSQMASLEYNRKREYELLHRKIEDAVHAAPCNTPASTAGPQAEPTKSEKLELLRLWLILLISVGMFLGAFFNGGANMAAVASKLLP